MSDDFLIRPELNAYNQFLNDEKAMFNEIHALLKAGCTINAIKLYRGFYRQHEFTKESYNRHPTLVQAKQVIEMMIHVRMNILNDLKKVV